MIFWAVIGVYTLFLAIYWFFTLSILWHLREFSMDTDYSAISVKVFLFTSIALSAISLILFLRLPLINL